MEDECGRDGINPVAALVTCILLAFYVSVFTWKFTSDAWKSDAVKHGYAEWVIVSEGGETRWQWKVQK